MTSPAIAIADGDIERARTEARRLAEFAWARREALNTSLPSPADAVTQAAATEGCVALMDCGDNIGGGGPGDSTILFTEIRRQGHAENAQRQFNELIREMHLGDIAFR